LAVLWRIQKFKSLRILFSTDLGQKLGKMGSKLKKKRFWPNYNYWASLCCLYPTQKIIQFKVLEFISYSYSCIGSKEILRHNLIISIKIKDHFQMHNFHMVVELLCPPVLIFPYKAIRVLEKKSISVPTMSKLMKKEHFIRLLFVLVFWRGSSLWCLLEI